MRGEFFERGAALRKKGPREEKQGEKNWQKGGGKKEGGKCAARNHVNKRGEVGEKDKRK